MADKTGAAIDTASEGNGASVSVPPCVGCGRLPHGSVSGYIRCLESSVTELRRIVRMLRAGER
jgi:hypothetical protein